MSTPAFWKSIALGFPRSPKPAALLAEFGAIGPYTWLVLIFEAKAQEYAQLDKAARQPGRVRLAWAQLGQLASCDVEGARAVLLRLQEWGELALEDDGFAFTATLHDWHRWEVEPKNPVAAAAKKATRQPMSSQRPDSGKHRDSDTDKDKDDSPTV